MKKYIQRMFQTTTTIWAILLLETVTASLLYTILIIAGLQKSTSFYITFGIAFVLAIVGLALVPKHLLLLRAEGETVAPSLPILPGKPKSFQWRDTDPLEPNKTEWSRYVWQWSRRRHTEPVKIFLAYAPQDESLVDRLETHLRPLQRQVLIETWDDRNLQPGMNWKKEIDKHLEASQIILFLVSTDFLKSDTFNNVEIKPALERYKRGEARVIPIMIRSVSWQETPFHDLKPLPTNGEPVTDPSWQNIDDALSNVADGIQKAVNEILSQSGREQWHKQGENA